VFERFTERARQVVVLAQEEARGLKHAYIGTEHLLLGLLREEEGIAARILEANDVELEAARGRVRQIVGEGEAEEATSGQIPFTPSAKKVLELALREALSLGHNYIGTEHVLLGLARENEGPAVEVLATFGLDAERIRNEVIGMLSGVEPPPPPRRLRRWEYLVSPLGALETAGDLALLGGEGWDLVAVIGEPGAYRGVFKRPA
jgi:ATP-dependent Clp protease ATP-binding subunit ClpC